VVLKVKGFPKRIRLSGHRQAEASKKTQRETTRLGTIFKLVSVEIYLFHGDAQEDGLG